MGIYTQLQYDNGVITGFADEKIKAWHQAGIDMNELVRLGRAFNGPIPAEVAEQMIGWEPVVLQMFAIIDPAGEQDYILPDRYSKFIANPNTGTIVNIVGSGYNAQLHNVMRGAIEAAMDAECDIASVVCLGDGAHMGMSFRARDGVTIGGDWGGAMPLVGFNSSLTSAIATQMDTGTVLRVCDNTMTTAAFLARLKIKIKRTRFSNDKITASNVREALDISFAVTEELCDELERMACVSVTDAQFHAVLEAWKPVPDEPGRGQTIAQNVHQDMWWHFKQDERNVFGDSLAGMLQAHNTWAHWTQGMRGTNAIGATARLDRQAARTATGAVSKDDAEFLAIVAQVCPELMPA